MIRKVVPTCPKCGKTGGVEEYGILEYTQTIDLFYVNGSGALVDTDWGEYDYGGHETQQGYQCCWCDHRAPRKAFVPPPGMVKVGKRGDDPAQLEEE